LQHLDLICDKLAIAISNIHTIIAPTKIYFGGGISQSFTLFEKNLKSKLSQRLIYPGLKLPEILVLNEYDGSKGAIHLALQNHSGQPSAS
jgi:predicted NBD/HSP70 family sugar kinase